MALLLYSKDHGWTFANGSLDWFLFYKDLLHLILPNRAKSITLTITSRYKDINLSPTNSNTSYSDITRKKVKWARLSTICQPILSNVSESRLHQRKPGSNVKLVSVDVSPVCASSVSELIKQLNIGKPVCSGNATKRNVCNASSIIQLIKKPLNVRKSVCSSKTTKT